MNRDAQSHFRAKVSHDLCTGTGLCVQIAPKAFRFNDELLSVFDAAGDWSREEVRAAADACPMSAIIVFEQSDDQD
jgi:ferredoxin